MSACSEAWVLVLCLQVSTQIRSDERMLGRRYPLSQEMSSFAALRDPNTILSRSIKARAPRVRLSEWDLTLHERAVQGA